MGDGATQGRKGYGDEGVGEETKKTVVEVEIFR